jgi:hypothetical protein
MSISGMNRTAMAASLAKAGDLWGPLKPAAA